MPLSINNEIIDDTLIIKEFKRLQPEYTKMYADQDTETQVATLIDWAKENVVENILLQQHIVKNELDISSEEIQQEKLDALVDALKAEAVITFSVSDELKSSVRGLNTHVPHTYKKQLHFLLVKPAGPDCNMACTYCFYLDKKNLFPDTKVCRMSNDVLEEMTKQAMVQSGNQITFGWQGGEPTLMGLPFFKKAISLQKKYGNGKKGINTIQTNGLLIDEKWAHFFKENDFLVGLSIDGPEHIHNQYRKGNQDTWKQVSQAAKLLLDTGVETNALVVVNDYSGQFPEEIYRFNKELGLNFMQFIPCVEHDTSNPGETTSFSVDAKQFGEFLCALFDIWYEDFVDGRPVTSIRFFESVFPAYLGMPVPECTLAKECGAYQVVEYNGDVYPCDFYVDHDRKVGNIIDSTLISLLNSPEQDIFGKCKSELAESCANCGWLRQCNGGCPKNRLSINDNKSETYLCGAYKMFFEHTNKTFRKLAEEWRGNRVK